MQRERHTLQTALVNEANAPRGRATQGRRQKSGAVLAIPADTIRKDWSGCGETRTQLSNLVGANSSRWQPAGGLNRITIVALAVTLPNTRGPRLGDVQLPRSSSLRSTASRNAGSHSTTQSKIALTRCHRSGAGVIAISQWPSPGKARHGPSAIRA
jgi:hypothetical protein